MRNEIKVKKYRNVKLFLLLVCLFLTSNILISFVNAGVYSGSLFSNYGGTEFSGTTRVYGASLSPQFNNPNFLKQEGSLTFFS